MAAADLGSSGHKEGLYLGLDTLPLQGHTHTHSDWDHLDTPIDLTCTPLGCERKQESLEKTLAADTGRMC